MRRPLYIGATALLALSAACSRGSPGDSVSRTDSAGVEIVSSGGAEIPLRLVSSAVRALGGKETPEEGFYRVLRGHVAVDAAGNIYVLDQPAHRIQMFDSAGRHRGTLGRQGGGPGELQRPNVLTASEQGDLMVVDIGKRALVRWGHDGEILPPQTLPPSYNGGRVRWTADGVLIHLRGAEGSRIAMASPDADPRVLFGIPPNPLKAVEFTSCGLSFAGMNPIFSPDIVWSGWGDAFVVVVMTDYVLNLYDRGRLVRSVRRDIPRQPATEELARRSLGEGMRVGTPTGERLCEAADVVRQRGIAAFVPVIWDVALAPDGTIWVQRYAMRDAPRAVDIFDPNGAYAGTLPEGSPFPIGFLPDSRPLFSEKNEMDIEQLVIRTADLKPGRD